MATARAPFRNFARYRARFVFIARISEAFEAVSEHVRRDAFAGVLPVAAKHRMSSVGSFVTIDTAFTAVHYIVSPLIALAYRGAAPL